MAAILRVNANKKGIPGLKRGTLRRSRDFATVREASRARRILSQIAASTNPINWRTFVIGSDASKNKN